MSENAAMWLGFLLGVTIVTVFVTLLYVSRERQNRRIDAMLGANTIKFPEPPKYTYYKKSVTLGPDYLLLKGTSVLPPEELGDILMTKDAHLCCLAASVNQEEKQITFVSGRPNVFTVPFNWFEPTPTGLIPDFNKVSVEDYGRTIAFGDYQVAFDWVLEKAGKL